MTSKPKIVVIGSANMDMVVRTEHIPIPGETVLGSKFTTIPGGKGGNQAVAAARLGADVWFVGRVGQDAFGEALRQEMLDSGINVDFLIRDSEEPSGVALIGVDARGQNAIIVASGANYRVCPEDIDRAKDIISEANIVVLQLEIPIETVAFAITLAKSVGTLVLLNPAPASPSNPLPDEILTLVDIITPNEHEALSLLGLKSPAELSWEEVAAKILKLGIKSTVITLGNQGSLIATKTSMERIPTLPVTAIDSTAAGDCFSGALAVAIAEGMSLKSAAQFATRAASISVKRRGAQPSLPLRSEVGRE